MAAKIKAKTGVAAELVKSSGGVFEISKDGVLIFSKKKLGRFPHTDDEVIGQLR